MTEPQTLPMHNQRSETYNDKRRFKLENFFPRRRKRLPRKPDSRTGRPRHTRRNQTTETSPKKHSRTTRSEPAMTEEITEEGEDEPVSELESVEFEVLMK